MIFFEEALYKQNKIVNAWRFQFQMCHDQWIITNKQNKYCIDLQQVFVWFI